MHKDIIKITMRKDREMKYYSGLQITAWRQKQPMAEFQLGSAHAIYTKQQIQSITKQKITKQTSKHRTYQRQENMYQNSKRLQKSNNQPKKQNIQSR